MATTQGTRNARAGSQGATAPRARAGARAAHAESAERDEARAVRTCVGCRATATADELLRLEVGPDGALAVDTRERGRGGLGRGAWVHPTRSCLEVAAKRHAAERSLKVAVQSSLTADELISQVRAALRRKAVSLTSVALRTRGLVWGADATREALRSAQAGAGPRVALLLVATDAGRVLREFGVAPSESKDPGAGEGSRGAYDESMKTDAPVRAFGSKEELGLALGRAEVAIAAVLEGRIATALKTTLDRIAGLEGR